MQISILLYWGCNHTTANTHTQRPQTKQWAWLRALWRLAWLALNQAGRWLGAQWRPSHHYVWVASSLLLLSKRRRWRAQTSAERGLTATEVHVCFGLLLITVRQAAKPLCCGHFISQTHSCSSDLPERRTGGATHCSLVWLPSGRTWVLRTGGHSPGTPAHTRAHSYRSANYRAVKKMTKVKSGWGAQKTILVILISKWSLLGHFGIRIQGKQHHILINKYVLLHFDFFNVNV